MLSFAKLLQNAHTSFNISIAQGTNLLHSYLSFFNKFFRKYFDFFCNNFQFKIETASSSSSPVSSRERERTISYKLAQRIQNALKS